MRRFVAVLMLLFGGGGFVTAGTTTLVTYPFNINVNPSVVGVGVTPILTLTSPANLYNYLVADDRFGVVLQTYPQNGSDSAANTVSYFTLSLATTASGGLGQLTVSFDVGKGGVADPRGLFVQSSINGYSTNLLSQTLPSGPQATPAPQSFTVDASGQSEITLRFYIWTPNVFRSVDFRNLSVTSTVPDSVPSAVPTLSEWSQMLLGLLVLSMIGWHFHRQRLNLILS